MRGALAVAVVVFGVVVGPIVVVVVDIVDLGDLGVNLARC